MSRTRNLADLLDGNGDVKSAALDNVPPSNDASALTTGTLPAARLPATLDGRDVSADGAKLDGIESGATADQSAAEIKSAYESNANTNPFTDSLQTKLNGIEASADVTDTANVTSAGALMTTGGTMSGNQTFGDDNYAGFGDSNEFQIKHQSNGQTHLKETGGGSLFLDATNLYLRNEAGESYFRGISDGSATLYHNNSEKLITASSGVNVTGTLAATGEVNGSNIKASRGVVQMVVKENFTHATRNSTGFGEVNSNYRIAITPKNSSNSTIFVEFFMSVNQHTGGRNILSSFKIQRQIGSSGFADIGVGQASGSRNRLSAGGSYRPVGWDGNDGSPMVHLYVRDNPNTTSTCTYRFVYKSEGGATFYFGYSQGNNSAWGWSTPFVATATEMIGTSNP